MNTQYSDIEYQQQLNDKITYLKKRFANFQLPECIVFPSPKQYYRMRVEFRIWHDNQGCCYAMFQKGSKPSSASLIRIQQFPEAHENINYLMPKLLQLIHHHEILKTKLYQVEFLTTLSGETLITLIYHKVLDENWWLVAQQLAEELSVKVIGRSRKQKIVLDKDYVVERLTVAGKIYDYRQVESSFTQPNAYVCQSMLEWTTQIAQSLSGDLLELYCGNGNFTLPLSRYFRQVLATELSKTSVRAAQWNISHNQIDNIKIARLSAEELTQALMYQRVFNRLTQQHIELSKYQFSTVLVDPPRAGVDSNTLLLLQQFDNIIYISCNPETLADNLEQLSQTHDIQNWALFDQFPYTHHIETGVHLVRRRT